VSAVVIGYRLYPRPVVHKVLFQRVVCDDGSLVAPITQLAERLGPLFRLIRKGMMRADISKEDFAMRAIWKGAISFGLVNIPISLFSATRKDEEITFRQLLRSDLSPIKYKRVAEADDKEVPWDQIVKGYEYQKDEFVVLSEDDLKSVDIESTQTVDIMNFVPIERVNPLLFYKPYYMECGKGGDKAYVLLRNALKESGKIAITKVVLKTRQHLAAIKPEQN